MQVQRPLASLSGDTPEALLFTIGKPPPAVTISQRHCSQCLLSPCPDQSMPPRLSRRGGPHPQPPTLPTRGSLRTAPSRQGHGDDVPTGPDKGCPAHASRLRVARDDLTDAADGMRALLMDVLDIIVHVDGFECGRPVTARSDVSPTKPKRDGHYFQTVRPTRGGARRVRPGRFWTQVVKLCRRMPMGPELDDSDAAARGGTGGDAGSNGVLRLCV